MNLKKLFHIEKDDNVAVPEIHSDNFDELQDKADQEENAELEKKDIVYDNVAIPEIHFHHKKMRNLRKKTLFMTMLRFPRSISITKRSQNSVL